MYKVKENRKCTEWPQTKREDLTVKKYSTYAKYLPLWSNLSSVSLYDSPFPRYKVDEIGTAPNDTWSELKH